MSLNKFEQPVKKAGSVFNKFLADVARHPELCPLHYKEWRLVPRVFKDLILIHIRVSFWCVIIYDMKFQFYLSS